MRDVQVIATLGPATNTVEIITDMVTSGMSIARLNFSWGTHEEHRRYIDMVRAAAVASGKVIPIIQDLSGPRVQQGNEHSFDHDSAVLTEKDKTDLLALQDRGLEYVALSFVGSADDIKVLRTFMSTHAITAKIIAKIERQEAIEHIDAIVTEADGIMIARGDLSLAVAIETLPFVTKDILQRCKAHAKPVIVATGMLTSMIEGATPSPADITDIAQAVLDDATATMLSNETAIGIDPVAAVSVMRKVVAEAQRHAIGTDVRF